MFVLSLYRAPFGVPVALRDPVSFRRPSRHAAPPVEAEPRTAFDNRCPIDVHVVEADAHMHHRGVIPEHAAYPDAAQEPDAGIAESIIHAAVKSDVRSPISFVPDINGTFKRPVSRSP